MRRKWNYISFLLMMMGVLFFAACGEKGGMDVGDGGGGEPEPPPKPTYNFTGALYSESGASVSGATIYIFSPYQTAVTNALGQFSLNISEELHTVLASKEGFVDAYQLIDLSPGATLQQSFLLQPAAATPFNVLSASGKVLTSNRINGANARLEIPPQETPFQRGDENGLTNVNIRVEYIDINKPLPVPLPSPDTLEAGDVLIGGKQAPSVLVSISPALLSMKTPATLILPNPHGLTGVRILYFSPNQHRWVDTGAVTDETPADGTALAVTQGGVYGVFYEEPKVGTIRGTATPRTLIFAGDEVIRVPADGTFYIEEVAIPPEGTLQVVALDPDTGSMIQNSVSLLPGAVVMLDLSQIEVGSVDVSAGTGSLFANGISTTSITVNVRDASGAPVPDGIRVSISTTGGTLESTTLSTANGRVQTTLTSSTQVGSVTVSARAGGIAGQAEIEFVPAARSFSLTTSQPSVLTDNSNSATITATVLDADNVPIEDVTINFNATGGQLSAARAVTDENGQAQVTFSAGNVDRRNQIVTITATINEEMAKSIPILIRGNTVSLSTDTRNLEIGGDNESELTITVRDASEEPIYDAPVIITSDPREALRWEPEEGYGSCPVNETGELVCRTDVNGTLRINVHGNQVGEEVQLVVESLGARAQEEYSISSIGEAFRIIVPETDPVALGIGQDLIVTINAPTQQRVYFSTTFGHWKGGTVAAGETPQVIEVSVANQQASAILTATQAGIATVQVSDAADVLTFDLLTVAVSAPSDQAAKLTLQASSSVVAPTFDPENRNIVDLKAVVKNANDQVVGGAAVAFSLQNTTGGGEFISPVVVLSDSFGIARATFTSGSLSSGAEGVRVIAKVVGKPTISDNINIIIGGTAGSVIIGQSTVIESVNSETAYELTMSVLVTDANGNPVPNAKVTLGTWPVQYATGFWASCINGQGCCINRIDVLDNEDENRNLILDPGEDDDNDGRLTPPSTAAGSLFPSTVTTGENGVAEFDLVYVKESAGWIRDQITATTTVAGSETQSTYTFWLPWAASDSQSCVLPHSPYNQTKPAAEITLTAEPESLTADGQSTSTLQAIVLDAEGNIVNDGTAVEFTLDPPDASGGWGGFPYATKTKAYTSGGIATVLYRAGNQPTQEQNPIVIRARSLSGDATASVEIELSRGQLSLSASDYEMLADGNSTSTITATLVDVSGQPASGNTRITFTISGGGTFSESGQKTYTTFASGGTVTATYQSGREGGAVNITATTEDELSAQVSLNLIDEEVAIISVVAAPKTIPADGASSSAVTATLTSSTGEAMSRGTPVTFTLQPNETGAHFSGGGTTLSKSIPTDDGTITIPVIAGSTPGTADVVVEAGGITNKTSIILTGTAQNEVASISVSVNPEVIPADGTSSSVVTAELMNSSGEPMSQGTTVNFSLSPADIGAAFRNGESSITVNLPGESGAIDVPVIAGETPGAVEIIAESGGITNKTTLVFTEETEEQIGAITVQANPQSIPADGNSSSAITATVNNLSNQAVAQGTPVTFTIQPSDIGARFSNGEATYTVRIPDDTGSVTISMIAGEKPGTAMIIAAAGTVSNSTTVELTKEIKPIPAIILLLEEYPDPKIIRVQRGGVGQTASQVVFEVQDAVGESVGAGFNVNFSIPEAEAGNIDATLSPTTGVTDENGQVGTVVYSGSKPGTVTVKATYTNPETQEVITTISSQIIIEAGLPVGEEFSIDAGSVNIHYLGSTTITVNAGDVFGNPVPDGTPISFKTYNTGGLVYPGSNLTNDDQNVDPSISEEPGEAIGILDPSAGVVPLNGVISITAETTGGPTTHITSLTLAPEDPFAMSNFIMFAGTDGGGVYKSSNSGQTWRNVSRSSEITGQNWIDPYINDVQIDPDHINVVYAATGYAGKGNLYRSLDGGLTWNSNDASQWNGLESLDAAVLTVLVDHVDTPPPYTEDYPYMWFGTDGRGLYYAINSNEAPSFGFEQSNDLGNGHQVRDIVRVQNTHGENAILYAGTSTGVYRSTDGGIGWTPLGSFAGNSITTLALYPNPTTGVSDIIYAGTEDAGVWVSIDSGQSWTTYMEGMNMEGPPNLALLAIEDIVVDDVNDYLYASTYFRKENSPYGEGNIFAYPLKKDGSGYMADGGFWNKVANTETLTDEEFPDTVPPQHALALSKNYLDEVTLYSGGEGISFHWAKFGMPEGLPQWTKSEEGLNNTIMARIPVVVIDSNTLQMNVDYQMTTRGNVKFTLAIEDQYGHPPTAGTELIVSRKRDSLTEPEELLNYTFPDARQHPVIPGWNGYPYVKTISVAVGDVIAFELLNAEGNIIQSEKTPPFFF